MKTVAIEISERNYGRLEALRDMTSANATVSQIVSHLAWEGFEAKTRAMLSAMSTGMASNAEPPEPGAPVPVVTVIEEPDDPGRWYVLMEVKRGQGSLDFITHPASRFRSTEEAVEVVKWFYPDALVKIENRKGKTEKA